MNGVLSDEELQRRLAALAERTSDDGSRDGVGGGDSGRGGLYSGGPSPERSDERVADGANERLRRDPPPGSLDGSGASLPAEGAPRPQANSQMGRVSVGALNASTYTAAALDGDEAHGGNRLGYRYVRPLSLAAESLLETWQNTEGRFMLGLRPIDMMTRGIGRGQLCYITGRSHSGKTQLYLNAAMRTKRPLVLFTLDETVEEVLAKLHCLVTGNDLEATERLAAAGDIDTLTAIRRVASQDFAHLLVFDDVGSLDAMSDALAEARTYFEADVAGVCVDYLGLLTSGEEVGDIAGTSKRLKAWTKHEDVPVVCIHQGSRTNSKSGQHLSMEAMTHAGENEASFVIGVRRKRDDPNLDAYETERHRDTVHVSVIKNKRPPSKRGEHEFILDPRSGVIRPLQEEDVVVRSPYQTRQQMAEVNGGLF